MPPAKRQAARIERLRVLLRENPEDLFLHREVQKRSQGTEEGRRALVEEYHRRLQEHPDDSRFLYLFGRALQMSGDPAAKRQFERALEKDPRFAWPHLELASLSWVGAGQESRSLRKHLLRFWKLCPDSLEGYRFVERVRNPKFALEAAAKLRAILERRADAEVIPFHTSLWSMEFRAQPPAEHASVRERVRKDLARIRSLSRNENKQWYLTLLEGYELIGDQESKERIEKEFLHRFGYTGDALDIVTDRWMEGNPYPADANPIAIKSYWRAFYRESSNWVKAWPDYPLAWLYRILAVGELRELSNREALAAADGFLEVLQSDRSSLGGFPPVEHRVARLYVDRGVRLSHVPALVQDPLRPLEQNLERNDSGGAEMRENTRKNLDASHWSGWPLLLEAYLKRGDRRHAGEVLSLMENALSEAPPASASAPAPEASEKHARGAQGKDGSETDDRQERILVEAWHRATVLHWKGRLAEAEGHPADAWTHYRAGLLALPDPQGAIQETKDQIEADARRIWKKLGGTKEGWRAALEESPGKGTPPVEKVAGGWRDRREPLPGFEMYDLSGKRWTQADLRGKVTFINVWATWCGPCQAELPHLQKLHERLEGRSGIRLLSFNVDSNPGQ
ncbi:MAG TPA: TlpA disulfide reductase family protein, partial [Candidatus Polarisedimenticolia bacterium]|nr:TlpA disulfide reductase family protein [Candidatus Polarisedimenticolia bacterium]